MNTKKIITVILLLFVVVSVTAMIVQEFQSPQENSNQSEMALENSSQPNHQVIAYYFHGNQRCPTCRNIEAYTLESLETHFSSELESGHLVWKTINTDQPGNGHYVSDYELDIKLVVLAEIRDGKQVRWKKLDDVWPLSNSKDEFLAYIKTETEEYMNEPS